MSEVSNNVEQKPIGTVAMAKMVKMMLSRISLKKI